MDKPKMTDAITVTTEKQYVRAKTTAEKLRYYAQVIEDDGREVKLNMLIKFKKKGGRKDE